MLAFRWHAAFRGVRRGVTTSETLVHIRVHLHDLDPHCRSQDNLGFADLQNTCISIDAAELNALAIDDGGTPFRRDDHALKHWPTRLPLIDSRRRHRTGRARGIAEGL